MFDIKKLTKESFGKYFEGTWGHQTLLYWLDEDLERGIQEAIKYNYRSYIGPVEFIPEAKKRLKGTGIKVLGPFSYPNGNYPTEDKIKQLERVMDLGADTCDGCLSMNDIKNHRWEKIEKEVEKIMDFAKNKNPNIEIKLIVEFGHLTDAEILQVAKICDKCKVDVLKMGTGWREGDGTSVRKVKLVKKNYPNLRLKGVSGQFSLANIIDFLEAGVEIIGSSSCDKLLAEWDEYFEMKEKGYY